MGVFDGKNFNGEVFAAYVEKTPNLNRNELIKSKAIRRRQDISGMFKDQVGGNYAVVPIYGTIGGAAQNYNGSTDIKANSTKTYLQGRIVAGRANAWVENDFSYDITGGVDFLAQVAQQIGEYWDAVDQAMVLSILKGVFSMTDAKGKEFVEKHTYDISAKTGDAAKFDATTLNTGMQHALGDNKAKFSLAFMHSVVATNLENLKLLSYMKYTDPQGIERNLAIGTLNGRAVLVDDTAPTEEVAATDTEEAYTKYTTYVLGDGAIEYTDCGVKVPYETYRSPSVNGGQDTLYSRQRKIFSPHGISWTDSGIISPTNAQFEMGSKWSVAHSQESTKEYYPIKSIPIARVISRG